MVLVRSLSYQVSPRVVMTPGDTFRATGGSYWEAICPDGTKKRESLSHKGPFVFRAHSRIGSSKEYIEAIDSDGCFCVLSLSKAKRWKELDSVVLAPYKITKVLGRAGNPDKKHNGNRRGAVRQHGKRRINRPKETL